MKKSIQIVVYIIIFLRLVYCSNLNGKCIEAVAAVMDLPFGRMQA